jgi:hypothetical protein
VLCCIEEVEIRAYHTSNSPTTIVIKRVWRWRHLRWYKVIGAELYCFGMRLENRRHLDPTYCMKLRDKFIWWERTWGLCSQDRRDMPTIGEENWVLKLEAMCTSRCHLWGVSDISRYEANLHLGSFVHSRSWKGEKKNWRQKNSEFLFRSVRISRTRFILRGVGLSHPKITNFGMWLKFTKF